MDQEKNTEVTEFHNLMDSIRHESASLKDVIMTKEEQKEKSKIINEFDQTIQVQVFSTLNHLQVYQIAGWRELVDEGDEDDEGNNHT